MAMMMDELDMTEDAAQVRRDHMPRFQSWDEADEMLVRITGENKGYKELLYEETGEIKYLGHVEVLVQVKRFLRVDAMELHRSWSVLKNEFDNVKKIEIW